VEVLELELVLKMNREYLTEAHVFIASGDLAGLKGKMEEYREKFSDLGVDAYVHTFRILFVDACQRGKIDIAKWLYTEFYQMFSTPTQKSVRTTFNGCFVASKKNPLLVHLTKWLERILSEQRERFGDLADILPQTDHSHVVENKKLRLRMSKSNIGIGSGGGVRKLINRSQN
jgi:hypothetical protein